MTKIFNTLALLGFLAGAALQAQAPQSNVTGAKAAYIQNQNYLSANSQRNFHANPDSLAGFDETAVRQDILAHGIGMTEMLGALEVRKRDYIKAKYNLVQQTIYSSGNQGGNSSSPSNGKTIGSGNVINVAPCVNEGFESTAAGAYTSSNAVTGWTIESRNNNSSCNPTNWAPGSNEFSIVATPITNYPFTGSPIGIVPHSPLGGTVVARMGDGAPNTTHMLRMRQTFPVTQANSLFQFAYAGYWQDGGGGHYCCPTSNDQPGINVRMYNCGGSPLACSSLSLFPGSGCQSSNVTYTITNGASWTNWQVKYIDLTPFIGSCITVEFINQDCAFSGHYGTTLIDVQCGGQFAGGLGLGGGPGGNIAGPVSFCAGSNQAMISAPLGYSSYQWIAPGNVTVAAPQGTMSTLVVQNPVPGSVYTVNLVSASGCQYVSTNTIVFSQVNIAAIGASSTCPNGASGSATVVGNGSGTGYNYTWVNSTNSVVGTQSVATSLPPGTYSVTITGLGSAGCGSAVATVTVNTAPPTVNYILKPYCSNEAYLFTQGGVNYKWYQGTTLITSTLGTLPNYTVTSPTNGAIYWVSYTTFQGCKDSTRFQLVQSQPGLMTVPPAGIKLICPSANNGTATINMSPAPGAPPGFNSYSVASTGTTAAYSASLFPTSSNVYTVGGLSPGTYTVVTFDGSCKYSTNFVVPALVWNYTVTPITATLCPGNSLPVNITFTSPPSSAQYSYSWSPTTWMPGGNGTFQNTILTPTGIPVGSVVTTNYTVVVTPTIAICPITKTIAITAVNPPIPTFSAIPALCNTFGPYQIVATPGGGTFTGGSAAMLSPGGIITPSASANGNNTFTYAINVNTCIAKQTHFYEVSQFYSAALTTPTVAPLCVTNAPLNLMNIVQNTVNGTWYSGTGYPVNMVGGNQFIPANAPSTQNYQVVYKTTSSPNQTACPDSSAISISVTKTIVPAIVPLNPICNNQAPINMTVSPAGGGWSGPNISVSGVITPTNIAQPGNSTVTYTVNVGPCLNSNSTTFMVHKFNTAALTSYSLPEFCYNSSPVSLMTLVQSSVNGVWMSVPGPMSSPTSFNPAGLNTNTYVLEYHTTSTPPLASCSHSSELLVKVFNPPMPTITQVGPYCNADAPVQLTVTPNNGLWVTSSFVSSNGVFTPSAAAVGNNAVQYVVGTPSCFKQDTRFISVEAFVSAKVLSKIPDLCNTSPVINLTPFTQTSFGSWSGPGIAGTSFNPAVAGAGAHVVTHKTSSSPSGLCPDQSTVAITVYSLQSPVINPVPRICNTAMPIQLNPTPVGGLFGGLNTGAVDQKGLFMPASAVFGENVISYSITSGPCVAYAQATITVDKFVSADFVAIPTEFCTNSEPVNMNSYVLNSGGVWSGSGMVGSMFDPRNALPGRNKITYQTFSIPTPTLCPDTRTIEVTVNTIPQVVAVANTDKGCAPLEVVFNTPSTNSGGEGAWYLGDGSEPKTGLIVSHVYTTPGTYSVIFNYSLKNCKTQAEVKVPITVYPMPEANFSYPDEILISSPQIQLTNLTPALGDHKYTWLIQGQNDIEGEVHPRVEFPRIGKYQVTLVAQSHYNCKNEITKTIEVKNDFNIFIPTSFTPNYDGLNDYFKPEYTPYGLDVKSFEMEIFDRWGHVLYHTKDITKGWDGSINNKGEPLKEEVYIYRIKYKDVEGNAYTKMGHVTLTK
jgi:gliding motility-associated-like protein